MLKQPKEEERGVQAGRDIVPWGASSLFCFNMRLCFNFTSEPSVFLEKIQEEQLSRKEEWLQEEQLGPQHRAQQNPNAASFFSSFLFSPLLPQNSSGG